ncbi:glycosyltransferase family 2 protein [Halomonas sp. SF2003]|nr:glycosyltransferase family 2 protein [Halomonas sp. SF2003]
MLISVIIPTYSDWERLQKCLLALEAQVLEQRYYEIIVVNNNSNESTPIWLSVPDNCKILIERKPGSYAARNTGVKAARGCYLAFTDSDCIPSESWLSHGICLLDEGHSRIAGRIELFYKKSKPSTSAEIYEKAFAFRQDVNVKNGVALTANLFIEKNFFNKVGFFDEKLLSGGDIEWNTRANKVYKEIIFSQAAYVLHPARYSLSDLKVKRYRVINGLKNTRSILKILASCLTPPVRSFPRVIKNKELSFSEKFISLVVGYYLNIYGLKALCKRQN